MDETAPSLPEVVESEADLTELLSRPTGALVEMMKRLDGDIMLLGISGKIGPELGLMALRAAREAGVGKTVIGVSRFSEEGARTRLEDMGLDLVACDLLDPDEVASLPRVKNIVYLAGRKFGTHGNEDLTWMANVVVPAHVARHFAGSRIVAFSTGAIYPMVTPSTMGCTEEEAARPIGEYAASCLGRERVFEYFSRTGGTPVSLIRLNYAVDLRYGVLYDIGKRVMDGQEIDLTMGHFNVIWQGDVNAQTLLTLEHCASPPAVWNITGPWIVSTRSTAEAFAGILGRKAVLHGEEGPVAFLSNPARAANIFGPPTVALDTMIRWQAHWLRSGGRALGKPTHFEETGGTY